MTKKVALTLFLMLAVCGAAFAEPVAADAAKTLSVRTFQFKHKDASKAAGIIKSLMSDEGTVSIQPSTNALTVSDKPANLKAVAAALAQFDTPPQAFRVIVRIVGASRVDPSAAPRVPEELKDVAAKLAMLRYNVFENLGQANVDGHEGEPGIINLDSGYRAEYKLGEYDPTADTVKIVDFRLSRVDNDQVNSLIKTTLNLKLGQTVILGATKVPQSQRALMIVISARR